MVGFNDWSRSVSFYCFILFFLIWHTDALFYLHERPFPQEKWLDVCYYVHVQSHVLRRAQPSHYLKPDETCSILFATFYSVTCKDSINENWEAAHDTSRKRLLRELIGEMCFSGIGFLFLWLIWHLYLHSWRSRVVDFSFLVANLVCNVFFIVVSAIVIGISSIWWMTASLPFPPPFLLLVPYEIIFEELRLSFRFKVSFLNLYS